MIVQYFDRQLFQTIPLQFMKFIILTINGKISYSPALENVVSPIRGMFVILPSFLKDFHPMCGVVEISGFTNPKIPS